MTAQANESLLLAKAPGSRGQASHYFLPGASPAMRALERTIGDIASTDIPVLLIGESGTGKEVVALEIHRLSRRWNEPFMKCGCAGLTGDSIASRLGCAENSAEGGAQASGSLFLDGINHLDPSVQARLLHLIPDGSGNSVPGCCNVRIISSTTRNLEEEMKAGCFREELYYRINGVQLLLPPLRDRKEDIPSFLEFFLKKYASLFERPCPNLSGPTMELALAYRWPGNIRELENLARKIVALGDEQVAVHDLTPGNGSAASESSSVPSKSSENGHGHTPPRSLKEAAREASRQAERVMILNQLERTHWNRKRAARELQISYKALLYKLKQFGLDGSGHPDEQ